MPSDDGVVSTSKHSYRIDKWRSWDYASGRLVSEFAVVDEGNKIIGIFLTYENAERFIESLFQS